MFDYLQHLLAERGMAPHGYCLLWDPDLIWTHVISDALIGLAYLSIPFALATFLTRRGDVQFGWMAWMFAAFIMACGATHFMSILTLWVPAYGVEGLVKLFTAAASIVTAIALWPLIPKGLALPSPTQLQQANADLRGMVAERDAALTALEHESGERQRAEEMLRQSLKMEAVGQLTGGIAHDFNNLLTVVIANLDRLRRLAPDDDRLRGPMTNAMAGAERAAKLTDQLLSFSRRQPLLAMPHDLNVVVEGLRDFLERSLGERVSLALDLEADLPRVAIDRNQMENAILNLAINARDAMPDGGALTIATRRTADGAEVRVSDTGQGMAPEVIARACEPFFTTKPVGQGTGLGLSQVYGFTKQSNGDIEISSDPGGGTTIALRLPGCDSEAEHVRGDIDTAS